MLILLAILFVSISASSPCLAWGEAGHSTVAEIALRYLSEPAKAEVQSLLGRGLRRFVNVSSWADEVVEARPHTEPWHVVEIPPDGVGYDRARDCRNDDCIVEKIKEFAHRVGDRKIGRRKRAEALKFLIHLVGDLHVPLHAYAPLNHPSGVWVRFGGIVEELHLWWDWGWWNARFEAEFGSKPEEVADALIAQITPDQREAWVGTTPEDWANASFTLAANFVRAHNLIDVISQGENSAESPITLPVSVLEHEIKSVVVQRLKMAGVRLAWLLNEAFK